ncbi:MAG: helix-turn-helix domain-containing protein [Bacteroidaceae bacterium]|nr:helix-turn-helix domain-containing protein [Bacteroidaceae bacterium]
MKDRISALMKHMGMSQKNFAAEICISEGALSSIFSGRTKPTLNTVNNIHERFPEVNMSWLIDGKGEMFDSPQFGSQQTDTYEGSVSAPTTQVSGIPIQSGFVEQLAGSQQMPLQTPVSMSDRKNIDKPLRHIAEIRVFYDDGTFETFSAKV